MISQPGPNGGADAILPIRAAYLSQDKGMHPDVARIEDRDRESRGVARIEDRGLKRPRTASFGPQSSILAPTPSGYATPVGYAAEWGVATPGASFALLRST